MVTLFIFRYFNPLGGGMGAEFSEAGYTLSWCEVSAASSGGALLPLTNTSVILGRGFLFLKFVLGGMTSHYCHR